MIKATLFFLIATLVSAFEFNEFWGSLQSKEKREEHILDTHM